MSADLRKHAGVARSLEGVFDRIGVSKKTAPAGNRGLTQTPVEEVRAMAHAIAQAENTKRIAADYLRRSAIDLDKAVQVRLHYVRLARQHGMTNAEIGAALGVTEAAVRSLIARNGGV